MSTIKETLYKFCQDAVQKRLQVCESRIAKIQDDLKSETKSSAGDKHETARAMLQLEREKLGHQLAIIEKDRDYLNALNIESTFQTVRTGSLVKTSLANYFIAISAGEFKLKNETFYAISAETPIGKLLVGKGVGDKVNFREKNITILEIQ